MNSLKISFCDILTILVLAKVCETKFSNKWLVKCDMASNDLEQHASKLGFKLLTKLPTGHYVLSRDDVPKWSKHKATFLTKRLFTEKKIQSARQEEWETVGLKQTVSFHPTDPYWSLMWYMNEKINGTLGILESWNANYTGNGVHIGILDGGVDYTHKDLYDRYEKGFDVYDGDTDPSPPASDSGHGTKCAGVALATANKECIIGVAYKARLIAIRLFGPTRQTLTSSKVKALTNADVHVSSNSWGVLDNTIEYVPPEIKEAFKYGVSNVREGKGVIYVFAGGNGGSDDNCNLDPYVNSIYTIGINSVTKEQTYPGSAEPCSAVLTCAYTGDGLPRSDVCSTSTGGTCVTEFKGTSAATPMAAGVIALALEANPNLHWRDVQELIIRTSRTDDIKSGNFVVNGVGRKVSDYFGYGLLDSHNLIKMALTWKSLPKQHTCESDFKNDLQKIDKTSVRRIVESVIVTDGCNFTSRCVNRIEHVEVRVVFEFSLRGAVELRLTSPSGTVSNLLTPRRYDNVRSGKFDWTYMSVHHWGEGAVGNWKLNLSIAAGKNETGKLTGWKLILYGTGDGCTKEDKPPDEFENGSKNNTKPWIIGVATGTVIIIILLLIVIVTRKKKKEKQRIGGKEEKSAKAVEPPSTPNSCSSKGIAEYPSITTEHNHEILHTDQVSMYIDGGQCVK